MNYTILTLGCKVNQFETQAMERLLRDRGHLPAEPGRADAVIVNTCAVTAESGRKSRQALRRLLGENPGAVGAVCGCYSQISPEELAALGPEVLFGSGDRAAFVEAVERAVTERKGERRIDDPFRRRALEPLAAGAMDGRTRAYMKIEDGCDNFCAYCVIPYARGRVRSMPLPQAAAEAARLRDEGFLEIVVSGIEIASYGKDLRDGTGLTDVLCAIAAAAGAGVRLRLGSLEPTVVTPEFCARLAEQGNICPQFHLSLQSGCDRTLKAMRRKYDTARFRESAALLRARFPGCALTADLICGFPGETEADFDKTLDFLREIGFAALHVFPYSARPGTVAAAMPEQCPKAVRFARARAAQELADALEAAYLDAQLGSVLPVLFEAEAEGLWQGHSGNYCLCAAPSEVPLHGIMKNVKIMSRAGKKLVGLAL